MTKTLALKAAKVLTTEERIHERIMRDPVARRGYENQRALVWLGKTIRRAREKAGINQVDVAAKSGMTQGELSRLENGLQVKGVTFTTLVALSEALGFDIVFELGGQHAVQEAVGTSAGAAIDLDVTQPVRHLNVREMS